jgi:hypothetical protein
MKRTVSTRAGAHNLDGCREFDDGWRQRLFCTTPDKIRAEMPVATLIRF